MACVYMTTYQWAKPKPNKKYSQDVYIIPFEYYYYLGFCLFFTATVLRSLEEVCPGELILAPSDSLLVGAGISEGIILLDHHHH